MQQDPATVPTLSVACIVDDGVSPFEIGVASEVFGDDRTDRGVPRFDFRLVAPTPGRVTVDSAGGFALHVEHDLAFADEADVVIVPAFRDCGEEACGVEVLDAIRRAHRRGAWVLTLCTGAFVAARAGVLDGGRATTHWRHADRMQEEFPTLEVACDALYVQHGRVITSAGTAGAIDAALHLVTLVAGAQAAATIARAMVMPPQRDGGQSQYATGPVVERHAETLAPLVEWMAGHLDVQHTVGSLAARAHMSERTFARRFKDELGTTPAAWLASHRVRRAQQLLEATDLTLDAVAAEAGFGTAALMRHHFQQHLTTTPSAYRQRFQVSRVPALSVA
ncbi:helix-turn-helix domain-containing protein [Agrococcus versicolor]|uniref:Helix-turn-helix domain-containing protein n=1 Tax=Agrococcus versicolor TaxID=501482 RepID=A0ABN3AWK6_9MICO